MRPTTAAPATRRLLTVLGPAVIAAAAALLGLSGLTLALIAVAAALLALILASMTEEPEPEAPADLGLIGAALDLPVPPSAGPGDAAVARWIESAAERVRALRSTAVTRQAIFDATDAPMFATSGPGAILACNRAACAFLDLSPEQIAGRELGDFFSQAELLELHRAARSGSLQRGQVRIARAGVVRVFQVFAVPAEVSVHGTPPGPGDDPVVVLTLRDVTELAQAAQLKTDFVANASHELRTPLASIRGAVETLEDLGDDDPEMRARLVKMIAGNAERLEDLTRDLLDLSRLESPDAPAEIGPVDLVELTRSVAGLLETAAARRKVTIESQIAPEVARVESDRRLLTVILRNLVENAAKFAYEGTAVRIVAEAIAPADGGGRAGLRLRVIDRGIGIPLSQQARIFERFFQGDPARAGDTQPHAAPRGTGLGLAIVKHAVRTLGGTIGVESVWKEGTTMTVEVPGCVEASG